MAAELQESANFLSCITDRPIIDAKSDNLSAGDYAKALCNFILMADTPVTIGIQGGWGSGKTSLIKMLQEQLGADPQQHNICVLVNAWEHSLFQSTDSKAEVALSLLSGLAQGLQSAVARASWMDKESKEFIQNQGRKAAKTIEMIKYGLLYAGKVMVQMLSNSMGTGNVSNVGMSVPPQQETPRPQIAESVHSLRQNLEEMVARLAARFRGAKIVFFVDDLDRVAPATAIEILDITKNIFDISGCVFVLAIDYEVVVKGLESKYGKKDAANEREFRQYFDKIIQIPFTMPIGAYADNVSNLLSPALERLGYNTGSFSASVLENLAEDARLATGGIPRSIKRIINTLSLLQFISDARSARAPASRVIAAKELELRFIIVALHINFPEIYRRLNEDPNFTAWKIEDRNGSWKLNYEASKNDLDLLTKAHSRHRELFDDEWERVVYCLCSTSPWLKAHAVNVSALLNRLLRLLNDMQNDPKSIPDTALAKLQKILDGMSIVSIDSENIQASSERSKKDIAGDMTRAIRAIQNRLAKTLPNNGIPSASNESASSMIGSNKSKYSIKIEGNITECIFEWHRQKNEMDIIFVCQAPVTEECANELMQRIGCKDKWNLSRSRIYLSKKVAFGETYFKDNAKLKALLGVVRDLYNNAARLNDEIVDHVSRYGATQSSFGWLGFGRK